MSCEQWWHLHQLQRPTTLRPMVWWSTSKNSSKHCCKLASLDLHVTRWMSFPLLCLASKQPGEKMPDLHWQTWSMALGCMYLESSSPSLRMGPKEFSPTNWVPPPTSGQDTFYPATTSSVSWRNSDLQTAKPSCNKFRLYSQWCPFHISWNLQKLSSFYRPSAHSVSWRNLTYKPQNVAATSFIYVRNDAHHKPLNVPTVAHSRY